MLSKLTDLLCRTIWQIRLLFKKDKKSYLSLYQNLGITPNKIIYYEVALSHKSMSFVDANGHKMNNERLEFLGDAVLSMVVADILFKHFKDAPEGMLTVTRASIVKRQNLNNVAIEMGINNLLKKKVQICSLHNNVYGNTLEALIGAIYLDKGYKESYRYIEKHIIKDFKHLDDISHSDFNYKSKLLEWCQKYKRTLRFEPISESVDAHHILIFEVEVLIDDVAYGNGIGHSKKEAEQKASKMAYYKLTN